MSIMQNSVQLFIRRNISIAVLELQKFLRFIPSQFPSCVNSDSMASSTTLKRWLRPEVYPLFVAVGVAVGICGMQLVRNICTNPEVRVTKENRSAGVLDNYAEGEKYAEHALRKYLRNKAPEIMPSINSFFADPKY